ncbi:redox-regulated ATPase YchF [Buchnera aphidicola (Macrosiphoniella sanborni)]|uniref:Ribosome-binding ATPase YchF n=1 Tax=Buchnera aphidicola (Macrosiphoniella sanborni) TaxID=1241865 RepID=A0A4D6YCP7_9GAMM|nr:redox-regulated ATPase YchF [Buchnera aphidicola]QCI23744.1 redox-regulated ATPase YchF [Buchnera aphidicola (Macrosiphoniella sanborni)]
MGFKCGIIGLPNVGKSTLFNLLTKSNSAVANFPFCTIKPNVGIVPVVDKRIDHLAKILSPKKIIHAAIEFIDIAGLVKGASQGEGLGNQFLNNIRETHAIAHVIRCFKNDNITHIYNKIEPIRDIDIINTELILSDFDLCEKTILQLQKKIILKNKDAEKKIYVLQKCMNHLKNFHMLTNLDLNQDEKKVINYLNFLTLKPTMYIANVNEEKESDYFLNELYKKANKENATVVPIYANLELDLLKMNYEEQNSFMEAFNIKILSLQKIISSGYQLLNLITFFTAGKKEIRAWPILNGSTSIQAAHKIHSDFSKGFIRAQIIKYVDFIKYKSESKIKEMGKMKIEGKEYYIQDGDIIHFLFNI